LNTVGIAGLLAGINWITDRGIESIFHSETQRINTLINQLKSIPGVALFTSDLPDHQGSVFSMNIHGKSPSDIGLTLDEEFGIMTRVGLHCAPAAHNAIGTFPIGTVRLAPGIFTTNGDLDALIQAVKQLSQRGTSP